MKKNQAIDIHPGGTYWMGGSSSPEQVRVLTYVLVQDAQNPNARQVLFETVPIEKSVGTPRRMMESIFESLVKSGMNSRERWLKNYLETDGLSDQQKTALQEDLDDIKRTRSGFNPGNQSKREDLARLSVLIAHPGPEDIWAQIDAATGSCCNSKSNATDASGRFIYECTAFGFNHVKDLHEKFEIVDVRWGESSILKSVLDKIEQQEREQQIALYAGTDLRETVFTKKADKPEKDPGSPTP